MIMRYVDLLERSWAELNCAQVVTLGLRRMGMPEAAASIPTDQDSGARVIAMLQEDPEEPWQKVSSDPQDAESGDVILQRTDEGLHVSLCIGKNALTSNRKHGVVAPPISRIGGCLGVYRFRRKRKK